MTEPAASFNATRKFFHWSIALILLFQIPFAWYMIDLPDGAEKISDYNLHRSFGITLFSLAVARLVWALLSRRPPLPADTQRWEKVFAKISQAILYILVCVMPVSGWMMSSLADAPVTIFGLFTLPMLAEPNKEAAETFHEMHEMQSLILLAVISLHACGALKHHYIKGNNVLRSMLPFGRLRD